MSLWRSIRLLNLCSITLYLSVHLDSHWWRTIQCAANSFSSGTSNRAGSNSSSWAVGLTLGSLSRHFWINSYKKHTNWSRHRKNDVYTQTELSKSGCIWFVPSGYWQRCKHMLYLLQRVLQQLYGVVDGILRNIRGLSIPMDFQECHLHTSANMVVYTTVIL